MSVPTARRKNRLSKETSPYLLQHSENPVDWNPWDAEALERAKREDRPILLSIGYAACHWCHVMERESFENDAIAKLMNEHFVCIKVDREERPDLDEIYMAATVATSGSGGWPMTVFLTPEREPFFAGTYFPPEDRFGRPGFPTLLGKIAKLWKDDREGLRRQAGELTGHLRDQFHPARPGAVREDTIGKAAAQLAASYDARFGGFGGAPKFPPSASLSLLLRHHRRTGDARALAMVRGTLDGMKNGGMYDQVGGGFARYSVDERWLVPHFEKMLYDNASLSRVYLEGFQATGDAEYRRVATETLDYVAREMQAKEGGYFSATDADSEGVEGKFFVWTRDEVFDLLGDADGEAFAELYDVTSEGNWEGSSILNTPRPLADVARSLGISADALTAVALRGKAKLYDARSKRVPPLLDDKILTAWNGLMIGSMAEGHRVLGEARYLDSAERAANHALTTLRRPDGGLFRTARGHEAHLDAYLEDYAYLADGLVDLYEAGAPSRFLAEALRLAERMLRDFGDPEGGAFFHTAHSHERLLVRAREGHDGPIPNPNAIAARVLVRLSAHLGRSDLRDAAVRAVRAYGRLVERMPRAFASTLAVTDFLLEAPVEIVLVGAKGDAAYDALRAEIGTRYLPNRVEGHVDPEAPEPWAIASDGPGPTSEQGASAVVRIPLPLIDGKALVGGRAALYVCRDFACRAPVTEPSEVASALGEHESSSKAARASIVGATPLPGRATPGATARFAARFADLGAHAFTKLGRTELTVSRLGFGCYRVDDLSPEHRAALKKALGEGVNLIDTSTNYGDGHSERLIGEVVAELSRERSSAREEIVVVSKVGYVQGGNLEVAEERETKGRPFPEMVKYGDGLWHCIHPEWLEGQLSRSLDRLGLETLDVCLLHNPEYYLGWAAKNRMPLEEARRDFYDRLGRAFAHLEEEVRRGRIRWYGVSSNSAVDPSGEADATELARMIDAAKAAGEANHFAVLQIPMNLREIGAAVEKNNASATGEGERETVLARATAANLAVLVNRPLNAIAGRGLLRLADPPPPMSDAPRLDDALAEAKTIEEEFRKTIAPGIRVQSGPRPEELLRFSSELAGLPPRIESLEQWSEIETQAIAPRVAQLLDALDRALKSVAAWPPLRDRYLSALDGALSALRARAVERSRARSLALSRAIDPKLPETHRSATLSQKALSTLTSVPGVTTVLVGMRREEYVRDALVALRLGPIPNALAVLEAGAQADVPGG